LSYTVRDSTIFFAKLGVLCERSRVTASKEDGISRLLLDDYVQCDLVAIVLRNGNGRQPEPASNGSIFGVTEILIRIQMRRKKIIEPDSSTMTNEQRKRESQMVATRSILEMSAEVGSEYEVKVCDLDFIVLPNVLSPKYFSSTEFLCRKIPFYVSDTFLEIGAGIGAISIFAALRGAKSVVSVDINPDAVNNTILNSAKHAVSGTVDCRISDIFSAISPDESFRTIFWNIPFVFVEESYIYRSMLERAVFDPGYKMTRRFVSESRKYLVPGGRILIGFGDFGDIDRLFEFAAESNYVLTELTRARAFEGNEVEFILYELKG
jgi:release factor glutamine methyltransferase